MGIIDDIRMLTSNSRAKREEVKTEKIEKEQARQKWLKETQIPKLARRHYREILAQIKGQATTGEDGLAYTVEHFGKPSRLDEETYPAIRAVRKKLIKDGFEVSDIENNTIKIPDTQIDGEHKITCSILVSW